MAWLFQKDLRGTQTVPDVADHQSDTKIAKTSSVDFPALPPPPQGLRPVSETHDQLPGVGHKKSDGTNIFPSICHSERFPGASAGTSNGKAVTTSIADFPSLSGGSFQKSLENSPATSLLNLPDVPPNNNAWGYRDAARKPVSTPSLALKTEKEDAGSPSQNLEPCDFAFLSDPETVQYLAQKGTKLFLVLRGVSGSGKSTLSERIVKELSEASVNVKVASADYFFNQPDGSYKFDVSSLGEAHEFCRKECKRLCASSESQVVIIDNTSIENWEFLPYLRLAHRHHFVTLLIEPKTAWRYDAKELERRNTHGVTRDTIVSKVEKLQKKFCTPHYYGFMISAGDSGQLQLWSAKLARTMLQIDQVSHAVDSATQKLLLQQFAERSDEELAEWKECQDLFHCTAFYTALGKRPGVREYEASEIVQRNLGKVHQLEIRGLLVTSGTISCHVSLNEEQIKLWNRAKLSTDNSPQGSGAHITVVTANGVAPSVAGEDTLKLAKLMTTGDPAVTSTIAMGKVLKYEENFWYLALDKPKSVPALFAAFYSRF